jgi:hypothetical protein
MKFVTRIAMAAMLAMTLTACPAQREPEADPGLPGVDAPTGTPGVMNGAVPTGPTGAGPGEPGAPLDGAYGAPIQDGTTGTATGVDRAPATGTAPEGATTNGVQPVP